MNLFFRILLFVLVLSACSSPRREKEKIVVDFDSISRQLVASDTIRLRSPAHYDSLLSWASDEGGAAQQLYYELNDFHGYFYDLKSRFFLFLGDSARESIPAAAEADVKLSNKYFSLDDRSTPKGISSHFYSAINKLGPFTGNPLFNDRMTQLKELTSETSLKKLLLNAPSVAAITILNSFERKLKDLEYDILDDYFKHQ